MRFALFAASLLLAAAGAQAQVYKWTDSQGRVHYSAQPPPNSQATEIHIRPAPSTTHQESQAPESAQTDPTVETDENDAMDAARKAAYQRNCEIARQNLTTLEDPSIRRFREEGQAEAVYYTDEERHERIEQARALIERYCLPEIDD